MINPQIFTFLVTLVNVVILFLVLRAILFKPLTKFMNARTQRVKDQLAHAETERLAARQLQQQAEEKWSKADAEAARIVAEARKTAEQLAAGVIADAKRDAEKYLSDARKQIETEQKAARAVFRAEAAALVIAAAGKLLKRECRAEDSAQFAAMLISQLADSASSGKQD